jgi:hypothetical protein
MNIFRKKKWSNWELHSTGTSFIDSTLVFKQSFDIYVREREDGLKEYKKVIINPKFR